MKKALSIFMALVLAFAIFAFAACEVWENPGDNLGGGQQGEVADPEDTTEYDESLKDVKAATDLSKLAGETSSEGATTVEPTLSDVQISNSGAYLFKGTYGKIYIAKEKLTLHFIFDGATFKNSDGVAIDGSVNKKTTLTVTLKDGTTNVVENSGVDEEGDGVNAIHVKGSLAINGKGTLKVVSNGKSALKASKDIRIVDATLNLTAENHGITAASVAAADCTINVLSAGKDGINAECDEANAFTTEDGYVALANVNYTCNVLDDGIQANTIAYFNGGSYNVTSGGKGIKVSEIEYTEKDENGQKVTKTVTDGNYLIAVADGTFDINSTDDAIHTRSGNVLVEGGTLTLTSKDDAIHADLLVKITGGAITITSSYEGIEGAYVEISGGTINLKSGDDGINAASSDRNVKPHIIISGGTVTVDASGDGIDSNGSILISGGTVTVHGPTTGADAGLDADNGIVVTGGTLFASSTLGMVETPSTNSTQYVVSYANKTTISAGSVVSLRDSSGNVLISVTVLKNCQSIIMSCAELQKGSTYYIYGGDTQITSFTVSSIITTIGTQSNFPAGPGGPGGGGFGGGPGGR